MIILTSFRDSGNWKGQKFSIAGKQPHDLQLDDVRLDVLDVFVPNKDLAGLDQSSFCQKYYDQLMDDRDIVKKVLSDLLFDPSDEDYNVVLCCWCNEHMHRMGLGHSFYCHRVILYDFINIFFPYIKSKLVEG